MSAYAVSTRGLAAHKLPQGTLATIMEMLFSSGELGIAKLDFSDFTGMYQDRARTIPYTAVEQPLGSFTGLNGVTATAPADVNRGVVSARVNLLTKTDQFDSADWRKVRAGTGVLPTVTANAGLAPDGSMTADEITLDSGVGTTSGDMAYIDQISTISAVNYDGGIWLRCPSGSAEVLLTHASAGSYLKCAIDASWKYFSRTELGYQGTGGRFSLTKRGSFSAGSVTFHAWGASFTTTSNAHLPYQRVNTATDYDTAGFPHYLAFNGTNTTYVTPSIDFTGTDKMTVWAGVTKLSDAAVALIAEFGTVLPSGGFYVAAPNSVGPTFGFASRGTVPANSTPLGHAAPKNAVLTGIGDISGDIASIRVNGVATTTNTDQGTGNYGNFALYIGARVGPTLYFNGRLYSLIVRGAQSSLSQIEATENLIRQKMRLP